MSKRETNRKDKPVEQYSRHVKRLREPSQKEMRRLKAIRRHGQPQQRDKPIGRDSRNSSSGYQRGEGDLTGQDSAQDEGAEDVHHGDRILGLSIFGDFADPA